MRLRAAGTALSSVLVLAALAVPDAARADESQGDTKIIKVVVNGGKDIVVGATAKKKITVAVTGSDPAGIFDAFFLLWHGRTPDTADGAVTNGPGQGGACTVWATDPTTSTCLFDLVFSPGEDWEDNMDDNATAGTWKSWVDVVGWDGDDIQKDAYNTAKVKREGRLTANATPEPVRKGKTITVKGKLTRADWETQKYPGYKGQTVKLQFRKKGSTTYTTLKSVTSGTGGALKATVKATSDGYYRFVYTGSATTGPATAPGDFVDVR